MKQISLLIILIFNTSFIFSQEIKAETVYQKCVYNSLDDKGVLLKKYTKEFESHLIVSKILKDTTSKAYFDLFKALGGNEWKDFKYNYSYIDSINKIAGYKIVNGSNVGCAKEMREYRNFKKSKFFKMKNIFLEEHETIETVLKKMLLYLEEQDFELDFYKYRTLFFLEDLFDYDTIQE
ncbi:MAG: hypothetical protein V3V33_05670 [Candidatus Lokiarchaeia archaeon]